MILWKISLVDKDKVGQLH